MTTNMLGLDHEILKNTMEPEHEISFSDDDDDQQGLRMVDIHDQLPSPEEYKAQMSFKKKSSFSFRPDASSARPDPIGIEAEHLNQTELIDDEEDPDHPHHHDDVFKEMHLTDSPRGCQLSWKTCGLAGLLLLIIVIIVSVSVSQKNNNNKFASWIKQSDRYDAIEQYLITSGISTHADLTNDASAQHLAAQWMAHGDKNKMDIPSANDNKMSAQSLRFIERYVLALFYFATDGPNWTNQVNWLGPNHVCTWYEDFWLETNVAELDDSNTITMGVHGCRADDNGELYPISIYLPTNGLKGTLPSELQHLNSLEILNFPYNRGLAGTMPEALTKMDKLRHLGLQWCGLSGPIPTWIGDFESLVYLGLGNNALTGVVPTEIQKLTTLELLGLDDNLDLVANIELFHTLGDLRSLYLENNKITGTISEALMASWPKLQELDVSDNALTGSLPDDFFNHANDLTVVDLHSNALKGPLPVANDANDRLEFLALFDNDLTGPIPDTIKYFEELRHFDVSNNSLQGEIPSILQYMPKLEYLFLGNNAFDAAQMPLWLYRLTNLRELELKNLKLTGNFPNLEGKLTKLEYLDLHFNSLTGTVPENIGDLTSLKHLILKNNLLTGQLPAGMSELSNLSVILLEQNYFEGRAAAICGGNFPSLELFVSDCALPSFECTCCDACCEGRADLTCNAGEWEGNLDPIWEYGYQRERYAYNLGSHIMVIP